jgi:hypothetical protein
VTTNSILLSLPPPPLYSTLLVLPHIRVLGVGAAYGPCVVVGWGVCCVVGVLGMGVPWSTGTRHSWLRRWPGLGVRLLRPTAVFGRSEPSLTVGLVCPRYLSGDREPHAPYGLPDLATPWRHRSDAWRQTCRFSDSKRHHREKAASSSTSGRRDPTVSSPTPPFAIRSLRQGNRLVPLRFMPLCRSGFSKEPPAG